MNRAVLIVGAGLIGEKRALNLPENMKLFGFVDNNLDKLNSINEKFSVNTYANLEDALINLPKKSLVIVSTIHSELAKIAKKAIEFDQHVLIEKPGALNSQELKILCELATKKRVKITVGYNHRFHEAAIKLREIAFSNCYGPIQLIRGRYGHGGRIGYENEWRTKKTLSGGGELIDQGSHLLDLLQFLGGNPKIEFSMLPTLYWNIDVEDNAFLAGSLNEGSKFWLHASWTEWKNLFSFEVFFKTAKVEWLGLNNSYGEEKLIISHMESGLGRPVIKVLSFSKTDGSWKEELKNVEMRINNEDSLATSCIEAQKTLELIDRAYQL